LGPDVRLKKKNTCFDIKWETKMVTLTWKQRNDGVTTVVPFPA